MKKVIITLISAALLVLAISTASANHHESDPAVPSSVIHVVTVSWKADATEKQIQAALDAVVTLAHEYDGITRVWTRSIKAQGDRTHAFVMEFKSEKALKDYADSDAQKKWYKSYLAVREASTTFDITN
ncbi:MAG: Dabb family protein [Verrucomicrobia bacterium]|nr:Dabb family protein [Verrucomicrobiota bacterium]MDA1065580.1 Dabb family protein [Verrucomicrobiota bacterium]